MSPQRVHDFLESWRAAERTRDDSHDGPERDAAELAVISARNDYLEAVRELAERMGSTGMADIPPVPVVIEQLVDAEHRRQAAPPSTVERKDAASEVVDRALEVAAAVTLEETTS
jgi:hypothetical protein